MRSYQLSLVAMALVLALRVGVAQAFQDFQIETFLMSAMALAFVVLGYMAIELYFKINFNDKLSTSHIWISAFAVFSFFTWADIYNYISRVSPRRYFRFEGMDMNPGFSQDAAIAIFTISIAIYGVLQLIWLALVIRRMYNRSRDKVPA